MSATVVELAAWRVEGARCPSCLAYPPCPVWLVTDTRTCEPYPCRCDPKYGRCSYVHCPCKNRRPEPHLPAAQCCAMGEANRRRWTQVDITSAAPEAPGASGGTPYPLGGMIGVQAREEDRSRGDVAGWAPTHEGPLFDEDGFVVWPDDEGDGDFAPVPDDQPTDHVHSEPTRRARPAPAPAVRGEPYARRWAAEEVTCPCETPWDNEKRPGGLHCTNCHTNWKGAAVMAMHQRRVTDPCRPPASLVDVATGRPVVVARRQGGFVIWG